MPDTRHAIELDAVTKRYGARDGETTTRPAVRDATFHVAEGEFFSLLGPSRLREVDDPADDRRLRGPDRAGGSTCAARTSPTCRRRAAT